MISPSSIQSINLIHTADMIVRLERVLTDHRAQELRLVENLQKLRDEYDALTSQQRKTLIR